MPQEPAVFRPSDLTYNTYLKVQDLLALQQCQSDPAHHDEMLFIVIHQAYELWFKLILLELDHAMRYMAEGKVLRAHHFLRRVVEIQKVLVSQIHILETMTPIEFLGFRDHLMPASGFQSLQFRELEFLAGLKDPDFFRHFEDQSQLEALRRRLDEPDLWAGFQKLLAAKGFDVPAEPVRGNTPAGPERDRLMAALAALYMDPEAHMDLYMLAEALVDFDTQLALWRFHHVSVVERVIGAKMGSGGSSGAGYLRSTVGKKAFPLLFEVRSHLCGRPYSGHDEPDGPPPPSGGGCPFHAG
jgi:tryptophan 2,3-dioxygenase